MSPIQDYTANFHNLSDEKATQLVGQYLSVEEDRRQGPPRRPPGDREDAAGTEGRTLLSDENKMDAVVRYDLAAEIPVVEE